MPWRIIIDQDQANATAESNGRFFNKTNRFAQNESECSSSDWQVSGASFLAQELVQ